MILFSPAKVNIGLHITERRPDGFHNLQSVMLPAGLCDILEIKPGKSGNAGILFSQSGIPVDGDPGKNLCEKAYEIMSRVSDLPPIELHLHKQIPVGAGLGGGSSNASITLEGLNQLAARALPLEQLHEMAAELGSDCPFFLHRKPMMMEGRGEILSPLIVNLKGLTLVLLFPDIHISTAEAYAGIKPAAPPQHLEELISSPVENWKNCIVNDFENGIFQKYPLLGQMKQALYKAGAIYASMSGSGSSLYGLFPGAPKLPDDLRPYIIWQGLADKLPEFI